MSELLFRLTHLKTLREEIGDWLTCDHTSLSFMLILQNLRCFQFQINFAELRYVIFSSLTILQNLLFTLNIFRNWRQHCVVRLNGFSDSKC